MIIAGVSTTPVNTTGQSGTVRDQAAIYALKESMDTEKEMVTKLVNSVPKVAPSSSDSNVGQNINVYA
jgi:predicted oxidoreductase (fatty acid repression mutant protein)